MSDTAPPPAFMDTEEIAPVSFTVPKPPSANGLWRRVPGRSKLVISREYAAWLHEAGWTVQQVLGGFPAIACRFDAYIEVPVSRRDTDNWAKPLLDLCERARVVTNDGNMRRVEITPVNGRTDCLVRLLPLPGEPGIRKPAKPKRMPARPRVQPSQKRGGLSSADFVFGGRR